MNNINFKRVVLGGLVAGLILNIGEFLLNDIVLGTQTKAFMAEHRFRRPRYQLYDRRRQFDFSDGHCPRVRLRDDSHSPWPRSKVRSHCRTVRVVWTFISIPEFYTACFSDFRSARC